MTQSRSVRTFATAALLLAVAAISIPLGVPGTANAV